MGGRRVLCCPPEETRRPRVGGTGARRLGSSEEHPLRRYATLRTGAARSGRGTTGPALGPTGSSCASGHATVCRHHRRGSNASGGDHHSSPPSPRSTRRSGSCRLGFVRPRRPWSAPDQLWPLAVQGRTGTSGGPPPETGPHPHLVRQALRPEAPCTSRGHLAAVAFVAGCLHVSTSAQVRASGPRRSWTARRGALRAGLLLAQRPHAFAWPLLARQSSRMREMSGNSTGRADSGVLRLLHQGWLSSRRPCP
mmetsp:Transcript_15218/g.45052  ORF Transcript_15218/g.45052 Transcript_15218/m.45052 type:complete len:252 (+) Transcript_15218:370-1125(+)